ncbi:MAG: response regulator [Bacteriovoracaceae bacterium]|nr:response regulator [Bacteriovoracaceae bacterium]
MSGKILIVDDETSIADLMKEAFEFDDFKAASRYSGNQAIEFLKDNPVDLVISDVRMPDGDGLALLEFVNQMENAPKLVFITGHSEYTAQSLKEKGAMEVFYKPLMVDQFISNIKELF